MAWEHVPMRLGPKILSDCVWSDLSPELERENITWIRSSGQSTSEVSLLDDYAFPHPVAGVNQYIFSACAIRHMLSIRNLNTTSEATRDKVSAFLSTKLDTEGNPGGGVETTLQKFVRLFRPYLIVTSRVGNAHSATIGFNGNAINGLFAGSNLGQIPFHPAATVQLELKMPAAHVACMPKCEGFDCGIFAVFDTDYSPSARDMTTYPFGVNRVRYVVAPTCHEDLVHLYEQEQRLQCPLSRETEYYAYEIAIRRIAVIPSYNECSLLKVNASTIAVPEYQVDFSPSWYHQRYMICLDGKELDKR